MGISVMMMEAGCTSETSFNIYQATRLNNLQDTLLEIIAVRKCHIYIAAESVNVTQYNKNSAIF
jgi:hypothetical protein